MPFKKGHKQGKGRPKGSKNKKTLANKEEIEALFKDNGGFEQLFLDIESLEPRDKVTAKIKVLEFFMAKHKTVEVNNDNLFANIRIIEDDGESRGNDNTD